MIGVYVSVPVACFRRGLAREYLETEELPPPATCYGFLLSLVGETDRRRHRGCRLTPVMLNRPRKSVVLRTVWRYKKRISTTSDGPVYQPSGNTRPDFQQLLTGPTAADPFLSLIIWLESQEEAAPNDLKLEERVVTALRQPHSVARFGGLCLGESTHLVDEVALLDDRRKQQLQARYPRGQIFLLHPEGRGRFTLPVWVDHVGAAGTRHAVGDIVEIPNASLSDPFTPPPSERMPRIWGE